MQLAFSKDFIKHSKRLTPKIRARLQERLRIFVKDASDPVLYNHQLTGKFSRYRSINITSDYRALYLDNGDEAVFDQIGTHSQLYG